MVSLLRADFIDQRAETAPGGGAAFGILAISVQNRRKRGVTVVALLLLRSLNRRRLRISAGTRSRWLITGCKNSQPVGTLSLPCRPVAVENQADGVRALARRYRRRIAAAVSFQCLMDRPRVTRLPIRGLRNEFVAARREELQAARRLPQQQPRSVAIA
jgi:hypothetical protein